MTVKVHNQPRPMRDALWIADSVVLSLRNLLDQMFDKILVENRNRHVMMDVCQSSHDNGCLFSLAMEYSKCCHSYRPFIPQADN